MVQPQTSTSDFSLLDLRRNSELNLSMATDREKSSKERVRAILSESVSVLCRTMLQYDAELSIRGLLGITVDNRDVFLVDILETIRGRNHDVSGVAVIDPGKEDSEADMLVVDDSDIEEKQHALNQHAGQHQHLHDKTKCPEQMQLSAEQEAAQNVNTQGDVVQMISSDNITRQTIGDGGAFARTIGHFPQLAHKAINLKSTLNLSSGIGRVNEETVEISSAQVMTSQALNMSTAAVAQQEGVPPDPNDDPNFRLQNQEAERQHTIVHKHDESREADPAAQTTMYALCACENGSAECSMKHATNPPPTQWTQNEGVPRSVEYATAHVPQTPISQSATSAAVTQEETLAEGHQATTELQNQDPYQIWSKANHQQGSVLTTSGSWSGLTLPTVSTVPSTVWAGQTQPQQQTVTVSSTNTEPMVSTPIQSLYSSLPETISSAILHTTYAQGSTTPKNLRGEGVFPCKLCSRVFTYKKSKARHMKGHLGQFYTCEVCKKTLCRKDVLARHQHNVHGIKMDTSAESSKNSQKSPVEDTPSMSLLSQSNEAATTNYQTVQATNGQGQRTYETVEFNGTNTPQLTVPRPQLAVVTSLSQPIQSFLTLNHTAIQSHPSPNQTNVQANVQGSLHGASPQT